MSDEVTSALARIEAGQTFFRATMAEVREDQKKIAAATNRIEAKVGVVEERLKGHMRDDDRRFEEHQADIDRAHRKIGGGAPTAYPFGLDGPAAGTVRREPMSAGAKAGWITGILSGLGALGAWLADHIGMG